MTRAEFMISSIKFLYGADMDEECLREDGRPFKGCFGFKCPSDCDCDKCPYKDFWEGDSNLTIPTRKEICK